MKKSSIAEHLINSPNYGKNYDKTKFRIAGKCINFSDLINLEATSIYLYKPNLNKHEVFDYTVSLFNYHLN